MGVERNADPYTESMNLGVDDPYTLARNLGVRDPSLGIENLIRLRLLRHPFKPGPSRQKTIWKECHSVRARLR